MAISDKRRRAVVLLSRRVRTLALFLLVIAAMSGVWNIYQKERESRALRDEAQSQLNDLSKQHDQLQADIEKLQTDRGKEEALRDQYAVGKPGEGLIIIVDPPTPKPLATSSTIMQWVHKFLPFW